MSDEEKKDDWFKRSPEADLLIKYAMDKQNLTYDGMSEVIGQDIRKVRHYWETARKALQNEHKIHFNCIANVGFERVTHDRAVIDTCNAHRRRKISTANRTMKKLTAVDYENLDRATQQEHQLRATLCFMELQTETKKNQTKLGNAIHEAGCKALPLGKTLELFRD